MDGEPWSDERFNDPRLEESPFASEVKLGELDLYAGGRFCTCSTSVIRGSFG
jgi:hypothetical protein